MSREAMQIALDALEANLGNWAAKTKAVEVLRQALETEREWVGLTDEEVSDVIDDVLEGGGWLDVARALEAAIKDKNKW